MDTSQLWIETAVSNINELRAYHRAPPLEWSQECYDLAKQQANECEENIEGSLGACRIDIARASLRGQSGTHGQNLLYAQDPIRDAAEAESVLLEWYNEAVEKYCFRDPRPTPGSENMTQLLWASTEKFALALSDNGTCAVANFFPAGNCPYRYIENVLLPEYVVPKGVERIGILFASFPPNQLIVKKVFEGTWADHVGVSEGDRFVAVDGQWVSHMSTPKFNELMQDRPLRLRLHLGVDPSPKDVMAQAFAAAQQIQALRRGQVARRRASQIQAEQLQKVHDLGEIQEIFGNSGFSDANCDNDTLTLILKDSLPDFTDNEISILIQAAHNSRKGALTYDSFLESVYKL